MTAMYGQLVVYLQGSVYREVPLTGTTVTIGRLPNNTLVLDAQLVSRTHAEISFGAQGPVITDVGSSNGTQVNDAPLLPNQPRVLQPGDKVHIGPFVLEYQPPDTSPDDEDVAAPVPELPEPELVAEPPEPQVVAESPEPEPVAEPPEPQPTGEEEPIPLPAESSRVVAIDPPQRVPRRDGRDGALAAYRRLVSRYLYDLPIIFHDNEFLGRYLSIFESLWEPLEQRQDHIEMYIDPRTAPAAFLSWLAGWFSLALNEHWPEARRRRLLAEATELYRWRGTRYGLTRMIEVCTGLPPTITDQAEAGPDEMVPPFVFRIRMNIPPESGVDRTFIETIIQAHKPAHAGYILEIRS